MQKTTWQLKGQNESKTGNVFEYFKHSGAQMAYKFTTGAKDYNHIFFYTLSRELRNIWDNICDHDKPNLT